MTTWIIIFAVVLAILVAGTVVARAHENGALGRLSRWFQYR